MGAFSRSWEITKLSFQVISDDKELLLFPLLATIFSMLYLLTLLFPSIITVYLSGNDPVYGGLEFLLIFATYLGLAFIATFFNVCVVYTTKKRFEGGNATFMESIKFAVSKIYLIFMWALVSATVGLILRLIERAAEKAGRGAQILLRVITSALGFVWGLVTIFVIPVMVYEGLGPFDSIKSSINVLKKTWGESLIRHFGLGLAQLGFLIIGAAIFIPLFMLTFNFILVILAVLYVLIVILIFSVANTIFNTALYVYASTGKTPDHFTDEVMQGAFIRKR